MSGDHEHEHAADGPEDGDDLLEAGMGSLSDEEWRAQHERLIAENPDLPEPETRYVYDPNLDPATLIGPDETNAVPTEALVEGGEGDGDLG